MKGTKKLKSIFIDHKVPIDRRETWPVVTDGKNRILWLPGLKKCYDADTLDKGEEYILITYRSKQRNVATRVNILTSFSRSLPFL